MKIGIVGAGISGASAAIGLRRALPSACIQIFERAPELKAVGGGFTISPNGFSALAALDPSGKLVSETKNASHPAATVSIMDAVNNEKVVSLQSVPWLKRYGHIPHGISRSSFQEILCKTAREADCAIHLNHTLKRLSRESPSSKIRLQFEPSSASAASALPFYPQEEFDLVIGADGLWSQARKFVLPELAAEQPISNGDVCLLGMTNVEDIFGQNEVVVWMAPKIQLGMYRIGHGMTQWFIAFQHPKSDQSQGWSDGLSDLDYVSRLVNSHLTGPAKSIALKLIANTDKAVKITLRDRAPAPRVQDGRVLLTGDAAHPVVPFGGQGANSALEDSAVLAYLLSKHVLDGEQDQDRMYQGLETGLKEFEKIRLPRMKAVREFAQRLGNLERVESPVLRFLRNKMMATVFPRTALSLDWLYGYTCPPIQPSNRAQR